jgi:hypothetical protein
MLDGIQTIQSIPAVLDISVTTMNWLNSGGRVIRAVLPSTLPEAFDVIKQRVALQGTPMEITSEHHLRRLAAIVGRERKFLLNLDGEVKTLEMVGHEIGLTRERIRQLESKYGLRSMVIRRWPLSNELLELKALLTSQLEAPINEAALSIKEAFPALGSNPVEASISLLTAYGHSPDLIVTQKKLQKASSYAPLPFTKSEVQRISRDIAGTLGFVRIDDVLDALIEKYPDADRASTIDLIADSAAVSGLPDEYLFVRDPNRSQFTGAVSRMLGCTNPLSISELRGGLERLVSRRRLESLPSNQVILATLSKLPNFVVDDEEVEGLQPELPTPGGNIEWMLQKIDQSGFDCIHKSKLFEDARNEGRKQSSIAVHCSLWEQFVTLHDGCIGRVGRIPDPALINLAIQQARILIVESQFSYSDHGEIAIVNVLVGTNFRNSGLLSGTPALRRQLSQCSLPIYADGASHGNAATVKGTIYGMISALNALQVGIGDALVIKFDFESERVDINFADVDFDEE